MTAPYSPMKASEILDLYFIENRAKILDVASFLDRIDRYPGAEQAKQDFRYKAFVRALKLLLDTEHPRTKALQMGFSDLSAEPLESAVGLKAFGAWEGAGHESD